MPPEQIEEVRAWLFKASHDLQAAVQLSAVELAGEALAFMLERVPAEVRPGERGEAS